MSAHLFEHGIAPWARSVRAGTISFTKTIETCFENIEADAKLNAWEITDVKRALDTAHALDALLASGTDLGWAMGLPLAVKDIIQAEHFPLTNGSNADTSDLVGPQGTLLTQLLQHGMVVLGKTRTVEFALGVTGQNTSRGTPWNPVDREVHRLPGGSSSGSAVAVAANHAGLALGTDTGGSVRIPATFCGIVGHKTSVRVWPTDGIFSLSSTLDSVGPLCRTVNDAALMHTLVTGESVPSAIPIQGLRVGIPQEHFFDDLDEQVATDFERALNALMHAGAVQVPIHFPEASERLTLFPDIVPAELLATLGVERFNAIRGGMDTVTAQRAEHGLGVSAVTYKKALRRQQELIQKANQTFADVDCWLSPTAPIVPVPYAHLDDAEKHARALRASWNTQPGNLTEFCATSLPMQQATSPLPTGLQIMMPCNQDARLLALSASIETLLNRTQ